jgi:hypothetical protein
MEDQRRLRLQTRDRAFAGTHGAGTAFAAVAAGPQLRDLRVIEPELFHPDVEVDMRRQHRPFGDVGAVGHRVHEDQDHFSFFMREQRERGEQQRSEQHDAFHAHAPQ